MNGRALLSAETRVAMSRTGRVVAGALASSVTGMVTRARKMADVS